jgi:hypothetical protein
MPDTSWLDDAPEAPVSAKRPTVRKGGASAKPAADMSWLDEAPEVRPTFTAGPRDDPSAGMSSGDLRLAGIGRGMQNVAMNVGDIVGRIPGLGGLRPSPESWEEFNRASQTLTAAQRPTGAQVPAAWLTGDPATDAQIRANIEAQYGSGRPGAEGSALGETAAVAPVAGVAGRVVAPIAGRVLPGMLRAPAVMGAEGATAGTVLAGPGQRAEGALVGGGVGLGLGGALQASGAIPTAPPSPRPTGPLASLAERAAVRSTNADRTAVRRAFKGSEEARGELGRHLLAEKYPLRSPAGIRERALAIQDEVGPEIGNLAAAGDASGATVDLAGAINAAKASPALARLNRNSVTRNAYEQITGMLDEQFQTHGGRVPPTVAHDLRMQLDELAGWDQAAPKAVVRAWRAARRALDDELELAMEGAGLGDDWTRANTRFGLSRTVANPGQKGLADIGAERRAANRLVSPSEALTAAVGGAGALASHPEALALPAMTWAANRYGYPVAARVLDTAATGGATGVPATLEALTSMLAGVSLRYLEEGEPSGTAQAEALKRALEEKRGR